MISLGIDTSNYTTSIALYNGETGAYSHRRRLLGVKDGETGLRQSDAVFKHTVQLPELAKLLCEETECSPDVIAVSVSPRDAEDSYMPCFMSGKCAAECAGAFFGVPVLPFSHQAGHIAAALVSAGRLDLFEKDFIAFHVSGGTTDAVIVTPDSKRIMKITPVASSLDLHAGQAVDRVGNMLGISFPAGRELDALSRRSEKKYRVRPFVKDNSCSLSGIENKCRSMVNAGEAPEDIAKYCITYIESALEKMTDGLLKEHPGLPLVFSGGVMSNSTIREDFAEKYGAVFARDGLSADNAVGTAVLGALSVKKL